MSKADWLTEDVKRALEIVPVEWDDGKTHWTLTPSVQHSILEHKNVFKPHEDGYDFATDFETQALIEKAWAERLNARGTDVSVRRCPSGCVKVLVGGHNTVSRRETAVEALAAAILALEGKP